MDLLTVHDTAVRQPSSTDRLRWLHRASSTLRSGAIASFLTATILGLSACGGSGEPSPSSTATQNTATSQTPSAASPSNAAKVRAIHASADTPAVRVTIGGTEIGQANFKQATAFVDQTPGAGTVGLAASTNNSSAALSTSLTLQAGKTYSVVALGSLAAANLEQVTFIDEGNAVNSGQVKLRVAHASPAVPAVDVYLTAPDTSLATASPTLSLRYKEAVPANGSAALQIPGGAYRIRITLTGTKDIAFDSGTVSLNTGSDLLVLAVPNTTTNRTSPVSLLVVPSTGGPIELNDQRGAR